MPDLTIPYVTARVTRNPMNRHTRVCLAHEVFILQKKFGEVDNIAPHRGAKGKVMTQVVDANEEYQRLIEAHGVDKDTDKPMVEEVFGQPFSSTWKDALSQGLKLFDFEGDAAPQPEPEKPPKHETSEPTKPDILAAYMNQMQAADPTHYNEDWWTVGGKAEVGELSRRWKEDGYKGRVTGKDRDKAAETVDTTAQLLAGDQGSGEPIIDGAAVMARMDDLGIEYDPDAAPIDLANQLYAHSVDQVQALGGPVEDGATLEDVTAQLDKLLAE